VWAVATRRRRPMRAYGRCERGGGARPTARGTPAHVVWAVAPPRRPPICAWGRCERGGGAGSTEGNARARGVWAVAPRRRRPMRAWAPVRGVGARAPRTAPRARTACGRLRRVGGPRCVRAAAVRGVGARARIAFASPSVRPQKASAGPRSFPRPLGTIWRPSTSCGFAFNYLLAPEVWPSSVPLMPILW